MTARSFARGALRVSIVAMAIVASSFAIAPSAFANETLEDKSRELFEKGKSLRDQGKTNQACELFGQANATFPTGGTMFAVADCEERAGHLKEARSLFEKVLADPASQDNTERLDQTRQHIAAIDASLAAASKKTPPPPKNEPRTPPKERVMAPIPGAVVIGVGGAGLVAGAVLGGLALSENSSVRDTCRAELCPAAQKDTYDAAKAKALGADISLAIGSAAVVAGIVLLLVLKTDAPADATVAFDSSGVTFRF